MNKFWIVLADQNAAMPMVRHPSREIAEREAIRLAGSKQRTFIVLEAVTFAQPVQTPAELRQVEPPLQEIPF